jgi:hypothetical protein
MFIPCMSPVLMIDRDFRSFLSGLNAHSHACRVSSGDALCTCFQRTICRDMPDFTLPAKRVVIGKNLTPASEYSLQVRCRRGLDWAQRTIGRARIVTITGVCCPKCENDKRGGAVMSRGFDTERHNSGFNGILQNESHALEKVPGYPRRQASSGKKDGWDVG